MGVEEIYVTLVSSFSGAMPSLILAVSLMIIGYVLGWIAKIVVSNVIRYMGVDDWFEQQHLLATLGNKDLSEIVGSVMKWYIFFIFLKQSVELINLLTLNEVLGFWINFVLVVIAALAVLIVGLIFGRFARNMIQSSKGPLMKIAGLSVEVLIVYIAIVMGIRMIGLPAQLLEWTFMIAFSGIVLCASLMFGIGFGLALKDEAKTVVKEFRKKKN